ncbi:MAG: hypothetical protein HZB46_17575 [Solirubrobacterales bacterium]|nr:hypothetical protein [Solirubrobacterales bacterium]
MAVDRGRIPIYASSATRRRRRGWGRRRRRGWLLGRPGLAAVAALAVVAVERAVA